MKRKYGKKTWCFPGGFIPVESSGKEPEFLSKDEIAVLNTTEKDATVKISIYYADQDPVTGYAIQVNAQRVRQFRINDLIDPQAVPLGVPYGAVLESDVPIVVQWTKQITAEGRMGIMGAMAYPADGDS